VKVLFVNSESGWRGGEQHLALLLAHLPPQIETLTACATGGALARRLGDAGHRVVELPLRSPLSVRGPWGLRRLVLAERPEVVHAETSRAHGSALLALAGTGVPLAVTRHLDYAIGATSRWKYRAVTRFAAVSGRVREALIAGGVCPGRIEVIHNGIDLIAAPRDVGPRAALGIPQDALLTVSVGQLTAQKDPLGLLAVWERLAVTRPRAWLLLVGSGDLESAVRQRAAGLPRVVVAGFREDVPRLLGAADLFVLASRNEGLPLAVMEAMAHGLPVAATRAGGTAELLSEGVEGFTVPVNDPHALGAALGRLLDEEALRLRLGLAARRRAERDFAAAAMAERYIGFWQRCAAAHPAGKSPSPHDR
jgi:glycosyltransferase involved in cell wall biosynthesis